MQFDCTQSHSMVNAQNPSPRCSSRSSRSAGVAFVPPAHREFQRSTPPLFRPIAGVESRRAIPCLHTPAAGAWHALGMAPSGNGARLKREPRFRQKAFHLHFLHFFLASNSEIASERARAPRLAPLSRVWPGAGANGTSLRYSGPGAAILKKTIPPTSRPCLGSPPAHPVMHTL